MGFSTPDGYSHVLELHMEESYVELGFENTQAASLNCDIFFLKWSGKFGQCAKMYPNRMNGYDNDETTELFRQIQGYCGA
jgi:hypothetical protein